METQIKIWTKFSYDIIELYSEEIPPRFSWNTK